jgi:hypothetical protein
MIAVPSGLRPHRICRTKGLPLPIQSSTNLAVSGESLATEISAPFGLTVIPVIEVFSRTVPPVLSNRARAFCMSISGFTPRFRQSRAYVSQPFGSPSARLNPARNGLNYFACSVASRQTDVCMCSVE